MPTVVLTTGNPRLVLRELTALDADDYFALVDGNRAHLAPWGYEWEQTATHDDVRAYFDSPPDENLRLGLWLDGTLVGRIDLTRSTRRGTHSGTGSMLTT